MTSLVSDEVYNKKLREIRKKIKVFNTMGFNKMESSGESRAQSYARGSLAKISPEVKEKWFHIGYSILQHVCSDRDETTWVCLPQLLSNLLFLYRVADPMVSAELHDFLFSESKVLDTQQMSEIMSNICLEVTHWQNTLTEKAKPGSFGYAQRMLVFKKFAKSYCYRTYLAMKNMEVETSIYNPFANDNDVLEWMQGVAMNNNLLHIPLELWRTQMVTITDVKNNKGKKEISDEEGKSTLKISEDGIMLSNQQCPILVWTSGFKLEFAMGMFDPSAVYTRENSSTRHLHLSEYKTNKIKVLKVGKSDVYTIPATSDSMSVLIYPGEPSDIQLYNAMRNIDKAKEDPNVKHLYVPVWPELQSITNIARGIRDAFKVPTLFSHKVGDIGNTRAVMCTEITKRSTSNIQHFDVVNLYYVPTEMKEIPTEDKRKRIVSYPYTLLIYDAFAQLPIYYAKIVKEQEKPTIEKKEEEKKKKRGCNLM